MSINSVQSIGQQQMHEMRKPPSPEKIAERMAQSVEDGDIDLDSLVANLTDRFGEEASGIVAEDGTLNVEALTELLAANAPEGPGGMGGQPPGGMGEIPPPPPPQGMASPEELEAKLVQEYGEEAASAVFTKDGIDFEALKSLLTSGEAQETGFLLDVEG